jgi:hypothetical protein
MNRPPTTPRSFSRDQLHTALADAGEPVRPDYLGDIVAQASHSRQRPAWVFVERWLASDVAVRRRGVPHAVDVLLVAALLLVLLVAGAVYVGSQLTRPEQPLRLPTTPGAWERVLLDATPGAGRVVSLAASPQGLLAVVQVDDGPYELLASTDSRRWTRVPPETRPALGTDAAGWVVTGTDRGFIASNGDVWRSPDGFDWQLLASRTDNEALAHGEMQAIAQGGPGYIAVGNGNSAWYSTDGSDWALAQVPAPPTEYFASQGFATPEVDMRGLAVAADTLVAWGTASRHTEATGLTLPVMWISRDGRTWSNALDPSDDEGQENAVAAGPGGFAAVMDDGGEIVVLVSSDGDAWEQVDVLGPRRSEAPDGTVQELDVGSVAASDAGFVATGALGPPCLMGGVPCEPVEAIIWTSDDGRTWTRLPSDVRFARGSGAGVVAWGTGFVVGGEQDGEPAIWISGPDQAGGR